MHITHRMEQISKAIIQAIASQGGYSISSRNVDNDSIDNTICSRAGKRPQIDFQLKSTYTPQFIEKGNSLSFSLSIKNYNDLRIETINPRILIVTILPKNIEEWIEYDIDKIILFSSTYWISILGFEEKNDNKDVTIHIPKSNIFNKEQLDLLFKKLHEDEKI